MNGVSPRVGDAPLIVSTGDGAESVVFPPSMFAGAWIWDEPRRALVARDYGTVVVAGSYFENAPDPISITSLSDLLYRWLSDVAVNERLILVGNSLGSLIAIDFALRYGDRVSRLVIGGTPGLSRRGSLGIEVKGKANRETWHRVARALFWRNGCVPQSVIEQTIDRLSTPAGLISVIRLLRAIDAYDVTAALRRVTCPIDAIWGDHDNVTPVAPWRQLLSSLTDARLSIVEESGHCPMLESPSRFTEILIDVLERRNLASCL